MKLLYPAVFEPFEDGSGGYVVEFPDLPGCTTGGNDLKEAIEMAEDAANGWILSELEEGNEIPPASDYNQLIKKYSMVNLILLDIDSYAEKYGNKAVRKNLTIPAWLNSFAEKNNINYSKVLQDALLVMAQSQIRI